MKDYKPYNYLSKEYNIKKIKYYLLNKLLTMFKYEGLPDTIPQRELEKMLLLNGFACVAKVNDDLYAFEGGLGGELDVYYRPTICTVANPALNLSKDFHINDDCIIVRNDSNREGMTWLLDKYATLLCENEISMQICLYNNRLVSVLSAGDDSTKQSASEFLSRIVKGELGVIADNAFLESLKVHQIQHTLHAMQDIITSNQYLRATFLNDIGLEANTQLKKERLVSAEVEINSSSLYPTPDDMLHNRQETLALVNDMFGTSIKVEFTSSWDYRAFGGANIYNPSETIELPEGEQVQSDGEQVQSDEAGEQVQSDEAGEQAKADEEGEALEVDEEGEKEK